MSRRGENIYKRKDGRWEGRYIRSDQEGGKAKYGSVYGRSYREVKEKLLQVSSRKGMTEIPPSNDPTVAQLFEEWMHRVKRNNKESTYVKYHNLAVHHLLPSLGNIPLSQLTSRRIEQFTQEQMERGRLDRTGGLSRKTVKDMLSLLRSCLNYAKCEYPLSFQEIHIHYPKESYREMRVLSQKEQMALEKTLTNRMDPSKLGVYISLYTGLRLGEICALRWDDVQLQEGVLRIRRTLQRIQDLSGQGNKTKIILAPPKSRCSIREIPLPDFLLQTLRPFCQANPQAYVLTQRTDKSMEPRTYQNHFQAYLKESGIHNASFHTLRHTFATRCVEAGFEIKSLSEILGHANVNITLNRYVHSSQTLKRENMNKLFHMQQNPQKPIAVNQFGQQS